MVTLPSTEPANTSYTWLYFNTNDPKGADKKLPLGKETKIFF